MKYFTLEELTRSAKAEELNINNTPRDKQTQALISLVDNVLDPLREKFKRPIIVNSGYRCASLNKAVRGATNSQHIQGQAADIDTGTRLWNKQIFNIIKDNLPFDQLINERNYSWIHVSYKSDGKNRGQILSL